MSKGRIVEAYCWKPVKRAKNPLNGKKQFVAGGCMIGFEEKGKIKWTGAGTVKLIPISRKDLKQISKRR